MESSGFLSVGCVTTLRLPYATEWERKTSVDILSTFVSYHLAKGFAHMILFFDDSNDPSRECFYIQQQQQAGKVTTFVRSEELDELQKNICSLYSKLAPFKDEEVPARQQLNAEYALLTSAKFFELSWLLHLDVDELFYTSSETIYEHFQQLSQAGIGHITYANHEGVPETVNIGNYFREVTLFRRNHHTLPLTTAAQNFMKWFESRTRHGQYMLFYDNGKSAVRVENGVVPVSVHSFKLPENSELRYCQTFRDIRNHRPDTIYTEDQDVHIFHYPVCGEFWFKQKYETLGNFKSSWMGDSLRIAPSFHLDCRDEMLQDPQRFLELFRTQVLYKTNSSPESRSFANQLIASQVCFRCDDIPRFISYQKLTRTNCALRKFPLSAQSGLGTSTINNNSNNTEDRIEGGGVSDASKLWLIANISRDYL